MAPPRKKKNHDRNWNLYNAYQTEEQVTFLRILNDVVDSLNIRERYRGTGRKPHPMRDMIKCCCIKVYNDFSTRRSNMDILLAHYMGIIGTRPSWNSVIDYFNNPEMPRHLTKAYKKIAALFVDIETCFAIDATGFSTNSQKIWRQSVYQKKDKVSGKVDYRFDNRLVKDFKKLHIISGYITNVITEARITKGSTHDVRCYDNLMKECAKVFNMKEVAADKAYLSRKSCQTTADLGIDPYIMPKDNVTGLSKGYPAWNKMIYFWKKNEPKFREHYHKRSNVESTFGSLKGKFSGFLRNKNEIAQENELLCKVMCHNISMLVRALFELKLDYPDFRNPAS